jgi:hypothetical protein
MEAANGKECGIAREFRSQKTYFSVNKGNAREWKYIDLRSRAV